MRTFVLEDEAVHAFFDLFFNVAQPVKMTFHGFPDETFKVERKIIFGSSPRNWT